LVYDAPCTLPLEARRAGEAPRLPAAAAPLLPPPFVEAANSLLRRLLAPAPADRPLLNAVLADPLCVNAATLLQQRGAAAAPQDPQHAAVLAARRALGEAALAPPRPIGVPFALPPADGAVAALAACVAGRVGEAPFAAAPWRLDISQEGGGVDTERGLDALVAAAMRPSEQLFSGGGVVLPLAVRPGREGALVAVGAALAQAALQGAVALDALGRLPPFFFEVLQRGAEDVLARDLCTLSGALAALAEVEPEKASYYRGILQGTADVGSMLTAPDWMGVPRDITDANKLDVVRRDCEDTLLRQRADAWALLRRGFLLGGGQRAVDAMAAAGVPSLRPLVYDPGERQRRELLLSAEQRAQAERDEALVRSSTRPCPSCGFPCEKVSGCLHVWCPVAACRAAWNWCCGTVGIAGHPYSTCPRGGRV
jgi:hypothetical protein